MEGDDYFGEEDAIRLHMYVSDWDSALR